MVVGDMGGPQQQIEAGFHVTPLPVGRPSQAGFARRCKGRCCMRRLAGKPEVYFCRGPGHLGRHGRSPGHTRPGPRRRRHCRRSGRDPHRLRHVGRRRFSSVAAALLKLAGYDVVGITLQLYDYGEAVRRKGACCAGQDIHDARRVAATLGIPHYVLDFEIAFQGDGDRRIRRGLFGRRDADPLRYLQPDGQVRRSAQKVARSRCGGAGDRALYRKPAARAGLAHPRSLHARRHGPRPELFSLRHDAGADRLSALSAGLAHQERDTRRSPPRSDWRWRRSPTARTSASCRKAAMPT